MPLGGYRIATHNCNRNSFMYNGDIDVIVTFIVSNIAGCEADYLDGQIHFE